ncbi:PREDICTED: olfactory receptor 5V1-like [Nanorana parkeri]|uniref:olfactory receptor 5V1-like n=1 Tax=Nanorana parkeri TaxID=125878 RepID=UPI0008548180|nr:PREDICTED: olfactory receptor 5V1-like [Nanorana parkeri]
MLEKNQTVVTEFLLLGFGNLHELRILLFVLCLVIHINAVTGNVLVIVLVLVNQSLHFPMYFFLSQLSLSEILFTTNIVPSMLWLILVGCGRVSVNRCISQLFLLGVPTINQCLLLAAMSFDRHVAICKPLHYTIIMTFKLQVQMSLSCWLVGFTFSFVIYILLDRLEFCGPNIINHFYCDIAPVVELSCSDTSVVMLVTSLLSFPVVISPFIFILVTYISILSTILKIPSNTGRQKAFSTCSSHLTVACLYYGTLSFLYIFPPSNNSVNVNKGLSLLYTLLTPLFNPLIYSLRNHDIRKAINRHIKQWTKYPIR